MAQIRNVTAVVLITLAMPALAAGPPAERRNFVSCPIVQDTKTVPCWMADYNGERYYLGIQGSFGSAFWAHTWMHLWIYFTAPVAGMLAAVELWRLLSRKPATLCCKHNHSRRVTCHCRCQCLDPQSSTFSKTQLPRSEAHVQHA